MFEKGLTLGKLQFYFQFDSITNPTHHFIINNIID